MAIRPKAVLTALNQRPHNGVLRAAGTDAAVKLLRSMSLRDGLVGELRERLHDMADTGEIIIECDNGRFVLIATPEALKNATTDDAKEETVIAPPGQRRTTSPRDGQGHELPAHLGPQHVGPLTITYQDQAAGEATIAAADLVREELAKCDKTRYGREELRAAIQTHLLPLYDNKAEVAAAMTGPVLSYLLGCGHAKRVPVPGKRNEHLIELILPEPAEAEEEQAVTAAAVQELDPIEVLTRLVPELEAAQRRIAELEALIESTVSIEVVAELTEKAEALQAEKEALQRQLNESDTEKQGLQQQLEAAASEKTKLLAGQRERLGKVRRDHESVLARLREENARALAAVRKDLETATSEITSLKEQAAQKTMPEDLRRRVDKVLGK